MNILIVGSGGREYTIGLKIKESPKLSKLYFIPGNGGTRLLGENIDIEANDFISISQKIEELNIELIVIGPETPLVGGIVDFLNQKFGNSKKIIGPTKSGAMLEGSKAFAKKFMQKYNIPTAQYNVFDSDEQSKAISFLKTLTPPYVLKADGLASGKGVVILNELETAITELKDFFAGKFGLASNKVVIEEFLKGIELSVFVATDGTNYKILPTSKDYKRLEDNDQGPNTGGMGAVSPVPFATPDFIKKVEETIIKPTIEGLKKEGIKYKGFLYFGLMNVNGEPFVIEYNCRLGDPETQAVLPLIKSDFIDLLVSIANETVDDYILKTHQLTPLTVVLASKGYPDFFEKNQLVSFSNLDNDVHAIHAGTKYEFNNLYSTSGRVICLTAIADDIEQARKKVYSNIPKVFFDNKYFRTDIGIDLQKI